MSKNSPAKKLLRFIVLFILLLSICPASILLIRVSNDVKLIVFAQQLQDFPLPNGAVVVGRSQRIFDHGNGMYCGFEASVDIQSELTEEEWRLFFSEQQEERMQFFVPTLSWAENRHAGTMWGISAEATTTSNDEGILHYVIYSIGHETFDMRC